MNGDLHAHGGGGDADEMALAIVDRTLSAIGGLETDDPMHALEIVLAMFEKARERLSV